MRPSFNRYFPKWIALAILFSIQFTSAGAQTQLSDYRPGMTQEGAVYFLPKTALRISVLVEKTTYQPGDFAPYAQRYLRQNGVEQEPSMGYRVIDVQMDALPVPDSSKVYSVKFDPTTVASRMTLSDDGRLLALNMDDVYDAEVPAPFVAAPQQPLVNPRQYMTEEILSCSSTAKMAELTAQEIYDLRENRSLLIKGQADFMPQDGRQMQIMLDELDRQDRSLSSMFLGVTSHDTIEHVLWYVPAAADTSAQAKPEKEVLFRLSQLRGLVEADDLSGAPYYIIVENITQLPAPQPAAKKRKQPEAGVYVNVPGRLRATIMEGITPIASQEMPAPQYGQTELLSGSLFNKRYTTHLLLDPLTGALLRLDAEQPK